MRRLTVSSGLRGPSSGAHVPDPRLVSTYILPNPAARNNTPNSVLPESTPLEPAAASMTSATPITAISAESAMAVRRWSCLPVISNGA